MVVYITLVTVLSVVVIQLLFGIILLQRNIKIAKDVQTAAVTAVERISREVRDARSVNLGTSTFATHPGALELASVDVEGSARTVRVYVDGGQIMLDENGVLVGPLTSSLVTVESLIFYRMANSISEAVRMEVTLSATSGLTTKEETFYSTVVLRGSY